MNSDPYGDVTVEIETWRASSWCPIMPFQRWEGRISFRPVGGGIAITIGNEHTGLLYGLTRNRVLRKAEKVKRDWYRDREKREYRKTVE